MRQIRKILFFLVVILYAHAGFALTIGTGPSDGTYIQIARDMQRVAQKDGVNLEILPTQGSFQNMVLLGDRKIDLAIAQFDALGFFARVMKPQGVNVLDTIRVVLHLYPEEIHVLTNDPTVTTIYQLQGKRISFGPKDGGSALTGEVLLNAYGMKVEKFYLDPKDALARLRQRQLDGMIFVAGAPVPLFKDLGAGFRFLTLPKDESLEQTYDRKIFDRSLYNWANETETYSVASVLMGRESNDKLYAANVQRLILSILSNQDQLKASGHEKWKSSSINNPLRYNAYGPANDAINLYQQLQALGYKIYRPQ
ncbi:MAG TPA: TAXI family TRAP transporter solute-binding subunit [Candidatus Acidoferrales bacterium]|nr:TAXI family TRAP transporter solute-binding subunit [Candidatus Acidoferrales bacterium]